ncbi:hypothetical protein CERZMDRAFT_98554 [Cercospora zeae-maydis SCOH1-5]|uniref:Uncharacterized protein n=1 Tax=Cercospora zeae-maydis SCOH1-5 TaxID=717836 RepID=A0A6A6FCQ1_9PEZI|nr:hypothetical protein CERZMDRAFT_98554 [Cercospora zeae-maydis SCOH1-5]
MIKKAKGGPDLSKLSALASGKFLCSELMIRIDRLERAERGKITVTLECLEKKVGDHESLSVKAAAAAAIRHMLQTVCNISCLVEDDPWSELEQKDHIHRNTKDIPADQATRSKYTSETIEKVKTLWHESSRSEIRGISGGS